MALQASYDSAGQRDVVTAQGSHGSRVGSIRAASLQFVRKIAGTTKPSKQNTEAFDRAVEAIFQSSKELLDGLVATTPPRDRARFEQLKRLRYAAKAEAR